MEDRTIIAPSATREFDLAVRAPGSKSITNRALICAGLADGRSALIGVAPGDDTEAMMRALRALGIDVSADPGARGGGDGPRALGVQGSGGRLRPVGDTIECGLAGTTSRFISALVALGSSPVTIDGAERLRQRPMRALFTALSDLGATIIGGGDRLPASISGPLRGGSVQLPGDVSSQFISALMMIGPYLDSGLEIVMETELVSRPYVEMTAAIMEQFGVSADVVGDRVVIVPGRYRGCEIEIEADASSASYPAALVALRGGRVTLEGVGSTSLQGDRCFADVLEAMGCGVAWADRAVTIERDSSLVLRAVDVDLREASDLVPSVAVVAAGATGTTRIRGVGFIRHKESDRIGDLAGELRRVGVDAVEQADGLDITGADVLETRGVVQTHHDHRLAMAFAVLASATQTPLAIADPAVVSKSWPEFWDQLERWCSNPVSRSVTDDPPPGGP